MHECDGDKNNHQSPACAAQFPANAAPCTQDERDADQRDKHPKRLNRIVDPDRSQERNGGINRQSAREGHKQGKHWLK
jgi:hypothetical protein